MKIELKEVNCGYEKKDILTKLNLTFETGRIYCLLGANGIGKTTLFKTLLKQLDTKKGEIVIDGKDIAKMSNNDLARYISYVPQAKNYSYQYTVFDIVLMGRALYINKFEAPSSEDEKVAENALKALKIDHLKNKMYSQLSGGEQQIVLIARALAQEAKFILMDEPASNLDFENQKKVLDVLKQLRNENIGIIMSSHLPNHAFYTMANVIMVTKNRDIIKGHCTDVITEENLFKVYGVPISVIEKVNEEGEMVRCCYLTSI